jgi:Immunity protein 8
VVLVKNEAYKMKVACLKALSSPDIDLERFHPGEEDDFRFLLEATIGIESEEGGDIFSFIVCTPRNLSRENNDVILGYGLLIVHDYSLRNIKARLETLCRDCQGQHWAEISQKLARYAEWEFDAYH